MGGGLRRHACAMATARVFARGDPQCRGISDVVRELETTRGATIERQPIDARALVPMLERRVAAGTNPWPLLGVDRDTLGILIHTGVVPTQPPGFPIVIAKFCMVDDFSLVE